MSFGFSIGDFIAVGDKARLVYNKCKGASSDYSILAEYVQNLHNVIEDMNAFLQEGSVPDSDHRIASLKAACDGCRTTLDEVEIFLNKFGSLGTRNKRFIEMVKFIPKDVDSLKAKLGSCTSLLSLNFASISSLSVLRLENSLNTILKEYRDGKREATVVSQAIVDNQKAEQNEILEQLSRDLEDKDIHPEAIDLNMPYLQSWLSSVISTGGLEEENFSRLADDGSPVENISSNLEENGRPPGLDEPPLSLVSRNTEENLRPLADHEDEIKNSVSRPDTPLSHQSMPDDWHPSDRPDPEFVQSMLAGFFRHEFPASDEAKRSPIRIKRAFHQQDCNGRGYLTRKEVIDVCAEAFRRAGIPSKSIRLHNLVFAFDANKDGQYDEPEFTALIMELMDKSKEVKETSLLQILDENGTKAEDIALKRRQMDTRKILPWGWSRKGWDTSETYIDEIERVHVKNVPQISLNPFSFSIMASEAEVCVGKIDDFENKWLKIVPGDKRMQFLNTLNSLRAAALRFTLFENQEDPLRLSDLDAAMICFDMVKVEDDMTLLKEPGTGEVSTESQSTSSATPTSNEISVQNTIIQKWEDTYKELVEVQEISYRTLRHITGVAYSLYDAGQFSMESVPLNFPKFLTKWEDANAEYFSDYINKEISVWNSITDLVTRFRGSDCLVDLEPEAESKVRQYKKIHQIRARELYDKPWVGKLESISLENWKGSRTSVFEKIYVTLGVDNPSSPAYSYERQHTVNEKRSSEMEMAPAGTVTFHLFRDSKFWASIRTAPANKTKYRFESIGTGLEIDTALSHRRMGKLNITDYGICNIQITFDMEDETELQENFNRMADPKWYHLLQHSPIVCYKKNVPSSAKFSATKRGELPSGWTIRYNSANLPYYVNHNLQTTTWDDPRETS